MKSISRSLILFAAVISSIFAAPCSSGQDLAGTIAFADNQFRSGDMTLALKNYSRALFFSQGRDNLYLFRQIAEISYINADYETASRYYGLAYDITTDDSIRTGLLFKKATCRIMGRNFREALIDLYSVEESDSGITRKLNFYLGTCYFGLEEFDRAKDCFSRCTGDKEALDRLFSRKNLMRPSPGTARILSMILPGLGQAYTGDVKSSLNSFLLASGLVALFINTSIEYRFIDAFISVLPWYQRYYTGGYGKAEAIATEKRQRKRNNVYTGILKMTSISDTR